MSHLGIIVLDEAHHCDRDHPYASLLREFWARPPLAPDGKAVDKDTDRNSPDNRQVMGPKPGSRPRLIGLTASPIQVGDSFRLDYPFADMICQKTSYFRQNDYLMFRTSKTRFWTGTGRQKLVLVFLRP